MSATTVTGSSNQSIHLGRDGTREFPCRCGTTHRGPYAFEDWNHHNCFHTTWLCQLAPGYLMCIDCGATFHLKDDSA